MTDTLTVLAGAGFEAKVDGLPTGLVGTLGVRIRRISDGVDVVARSTSIVEVGGGIYRATLTAPAVGDYFIAWDKGDASPWITEDLAIVASLPATFAPSDYALCTVADVRGFLGWPADQRTDRDAAIGEMIVDASRELENYAGRWFAARPRQTIRAAACGRFLKLPRDLRADRPFSVSSVPAYGTGDAVTAYEGVDFQTFPMTPLDGVIIGLDFVSLRSGIVTIDGEWGFPAIPREARRACVLTVASWLDRATPADYSLSVDDPRGDAPAPAPSFSIPTAAKRSLARFKTWTAR